MDQQGLGLAEEASSLYVANCDSNPSCERFSGQLCFTQYYA